MTTKDPTTLGSAHPEVSGRRRAFRTALGSLAGFIAGWVLTSRPAQAQTRVSLTSLQADVNALQAQLAALQSRLDIVEAPGWVTGARLAGGAVGYTQLSTETRPKRVRLTNSAYTLAQIRTQSQNNFNRIVTQDLGSGWIAANVQQVLTALHASKASTSLLPSPGEYGWAYGATDVPPQDTYLTLDLNGVMVGEDVVQSGAGWMVYSGDPANTGNNTRPFVFAFQDSARKVWAVEV